MLGSERHMVHLGQIVIFRREPKDGNAFHDGSGRLFRQFDRPEPTIRTRSQVSE